MRKFSYRFYQRLFHRLKFFCGNAEINHEENTILSSFGLNILFDLLNPEINSERICCEAETADPSLGVFIFCTERTDAGFAFSTE